VKVDLGEHQLSFELGLSTLHTRLVEGSFPNYEQVIPKNNERRVLADRDGLSEGIRRVKISADRVTNQVRLKVGDNVLTLSASGTEGSRAEDELAVEYGGDELSIGFNHTYIEDILKHLTGENVVMALDRPDSAAIFLATEDPTTDPAQSPDLCLLMPLRLNE